MDSTAHMPWSRDGQAAITVVFIGESPLNPWHAERWGIDAMRRAGLDILYLDDDAVRRSDDLPPTMQQGVRAFGDVARLCSHVMGSPRVIVLSSIPLGVARLRPLAKLLADRRMPWCLVATAPIPSLAPAAGATARLRFLRFQMRRVLRRDGVVGAFRIAAARGLAGARRSLGLAGSRYDPHYALLAGRAAEAAVPGAHVTRIAGHSQDYELARARGLLAPAPAEDICVFIDQDVSGHVDWERLGVRRSELPDAQWYHGALLRCFAVIAATTDLRVVVLPHPRSTYVPGQFGLYEMRFGDTMGAISRARLVVGHDSTALGLAVLFRKPIVLLNSRMFVRLMGGRYDRCIRAFGDALGSPIVSMDDPAATQLGNWQAFDEGRYEAYRRRYLKHPASGDEPLWTGAVSFIAGDQGWPAASVAPAPITVRMP